MKTFLKAILLTALILGIISAAGCTNKAGETAKSETGEQKAGNGQAFNGLTEANPLQVNKEEGSVTFLAQVNGKYFYEPTRHAAVFKDGGNGEKAVFRGLVQTEPFYNALMEIGAKAGNNMTLENKETTHVQGDDLEVTVTWEGAGKEYKLDEVIKDSNGKPIAIKFGGNLQNSRDKKTGCLICLDSCPVGIASNSTYTYGAVEKRQEVKFTGNKDILPPDGTLVAIKIKLKK